MPTGVALHDARRRLFDAAERVLLRDGTGALTSRSVTAEAGVAKGVLHRHFADFDAFLADLVLDRIARLDATAAALRAATGTGEVADNLADALVALFSPVAVSVVALVIARDGLRGRLRAAGTARMPLLGEGTAMLREHLAAERHGGRIAAGADVDRLAPALIGAVHLLCTEREAAPPDRAEVRRLVVTLVPGAS